MPDQGSLGSDGAAGHDLAAPPGTLAAGTPAGTAVSGLGAPTPAPLEPPRLWVCVALSIVFGLLAGVVAVLWQSWSTVLDNGVVLPWGGALGALVVFLAAYSWGRWAHRRWVPGLTGLLAFAVLGAASLGGNDTLMPPLNSYYLQAAPGASWSAIVVIAGTVVATLLAVALVARSVPPTPRRPRRPRR